MFVYLTAALLITGCASRSALSAAEERAENAEAALAAVTESDSADLAAAEERASKAETALVTIVAAENAELAAAEERAEKAEAALAAISEAEDAAIADPVHCEDAKRQFITLMLRIFADLFETNPDVGLEDFGHLSELEAFSLLTAEQIARVAALSSIGIELCGADEWGMIWPES